MTAGALAARKPAARRALEAPHATEYQQSVARAMDRGRMPKTLGALLDWFAETWQGEVPLRLHTVEVWVGRQERDKGGEARWPKELVGGSRLGAPTLSDKFRRYMENYASELDEDGYYLRPCHAALGRIARRDVWASLNLFAIAQAGYDWKGVADRGHWVHGMYERYLKDCLVTLWLEYREQAVRLQ